MKTIFVTGITGLLGTNLAHELIAKDFIVYAIVRNPKRYIGKTHKNLHLITMGLWGDYDPYLQLSDIVIHIAAETSINKLNATDYNTINYEATKRLFNHANTNKVQQFIYISTANTIGYGNRNRLGIETQQIKKPFTQLFYAQSKSKAEGFLQQNSDKMIVTILNPTFLIGAYDSKPSSGKIIKMAINKRFVFYPPGGKNFVPVKDVVQAIIKTLEIQKSGERYLIANENLSYQEFFKKIKQLTNGKQILLPIPIFILLFIGHIGDFLRLLKIKTSLSLTNMKILGVKNYYSNEKSIQQLSIKYTPLDTAIKEAINYFKMKKNK